MSAGQTGDHAIAPKRINKLPDLSLLRLREQVSPEAGCFPGKKPVPQPITRCNTAHLREQRQWCFVSALLIELFSELRVLSKSHLCVSGLKSRSSGSGSTGCIWGAPG